MPPKRKFLTLVKRVKVIEPNNKNRSARKIAKDFGFGKNPGSKHFEEERRGAGGVWKQHFWGQEAPLQNFRKR